MFHPVKRSFKQPSLFPSFWSSRLLDIEKIYIYIQVYDGVVRTDPKESHPAFPWVTFGFVKNVHCSQISGFCLTTVTVTVAQSTNSSGEQGNWPNSHLGGFRLPVEESSTLFVSMWRETQRGKYYCLANVASLN